MGGEKAPWITVVEVARDVSIGAGLESVNPRDGLAYTGVALMLFAAALIACAAPAWRAMRVEPASVLRQE